MPKAARLGQGKFCGFVAAKGVGIKKDAGRCCLVPVSAISLPAGYNQGEKWLVIGFLEGEVEKLDLPEWKRKV